MSTLNQITFFGSGPVAAKSLELLLKHAPVSLVVTKTSTKSMLEAIAGDIRVLTVDNKTELDQLISKNILPKKLGVLIDFGIIVSQQAIDYFDRGIVNSHFSLLPQWRGADPITFALLSGQEKTGVSLMQLSAGMDTGPIISQASCEINADDTSITLTQSLIELSDALLKECLEEYVADTLVLQDQVLAAEIAGISPEPSYSRKLTKEDGVVAWDKPATIIEREVRAYLTWPKSLARIGNIDIILKKVSLQNQAGNPGEYIKTKDSLTVFCGEGSLELISVQPLGKKEMPIRAFLAGYGSRLEEDY